MASLLLALLTTSSLRERVLYYIDSSSILFSLQTVSYTSFSVFIKLRPSDYIRVVLPRDGCDNGLLKRFADEFRRAYRRVHLRLVKPVDRAMQALETLKRMSLSIDVITGDAAS